MSWSSDVVPGDPGSFEFPELEGVPLAQLERDLGADAPGGVRHGPVRLAAPATAPAPSRVEAELMAAAHVAEVEAARAEGRAAGEAAARAELRMAVEALAAGAAELAAERERTLAAVELAAAELALALADKVIGAALEVRPELVVDVVRGALRRLAEQQEATVLVNPDDLELVRDALDGLSAELGAALTVRAERRVPRGGCQLRTADGEIDARVDQQLARARETVIEALAG